MGFSQTLITAQHDYHSFAPSWRAGVSSTQSLGKSLRNYDVESVNIVKTCEKLRLALSENQNSNPESLSKDLEIADIRAVKNYNAIPFRAFTNIWFGTLKIYQQQVNTLFRLSEDLLSRSCKYNVKSLEVTKRKSSSKSQKLIKKRRLTLTESTERPYFSTNYSELLNDLERLTQEPIPKYLIESSQTVTRSITQLQIREITIREICATTHSLDDEVDEDSGFGEATHEEIAEFLNICNDKRSLDVKKTPTKRKSTSGQDIPIKQNRYSYDSTLITKSPIKISPLKRSTTPMKYFGATGENKFIENTNTPGHVSQPIFVEYNDVNEINAIKRAPEVTIKNKLVSNRCGMKKKKIRLIIDECTKIDALEFIEEMKNNKNSAKLARKRILKSYKIKKYKTALELLTRFNRRTLKLSLNIKQKIHLSREQFEREYLNLLREIFNTNFNEKLASEIYPKWLCFNEVPLKSNKSTPLNKISNKKSFEQTKSGLINLNEYLNTDAAMDDINNDICNINQETYKERYNLEPLNACTDQHHHHEWRPYGVMLNLLNLWRFNQTNEIAAKKLFKLAENQIDRALGFYSLLNLSKNQFVSLTKFADTIALENILMGKSINNNII